MTAKREGKALATARGSIPEFTSREEMARWFDTHDMADHWDELKPTKVRFGKRLSQGLNIRLDPETLEELRVQASAKGIGPTTLARMWILERLMEQRGRPPRRGRDKGGLPQLGTLSPQP